MPLPTLRSFVNTWNIDEMGHMNVQFYVASFTNALGHLANTLGHGLPEAIDQGAALTARSDQIVYARELRLATNFAVESRIIEINDDVILVQHVLTNVDDDVVSASCLSEVVMRDIVSDKDRPLPKQVLKAATDLLEPALEPAMPRAQNFVPPDIPHTLETADKLGMYETCRNVVQTDQLDPFGRMQSRFSMGNYSDGASIMWRHTGLLANPEDTGVGGAVVQTHMRYHSHARAGQTFVVRGGFYKAGGSSLTSAQWLLDTRTGKPFTTANTIAVMFDTKARKACPLSDADKAAFDKNRIRFEDYA